MLMTLYSQNNCLAKHFFYLQVNHVQVEKLHAVEMDNVIPQLGFVIAKKDIKVLTVQVMKISPYINYQLTYHKLAIFW